MACRFGLFVPVPVLFRPFQTLFLSGLVRAFRQAELHLSGPLAHFEDPVAFQRHMRPLRKTE